MVALNPLSYIIGTGITYPATGMLLVIVGVGGLLYDRSWAAGIIIALNLGWVLCAARYGLPVPAAVFAAQLFKANALAIVLGVIRARTVRRLEQTRRDIHRLAVTDPLTGLANRRGLLAAAGGALSRRPPVELSVVYLDIDGLKDVNDRYGHDAGDQLIRSVATVLRGVFRPQDTVARIGGDEFAVLLIGADPRFTQQLLTAVHRNLHQAGISVSAGTAETTPDSFDAELADLLNQADRNMYTAKTTRKNRGRGMTQRPATAPVPDTPERAWVLPPPKLPPTASPQTPDRHSPPAHPALAHPPRPGDISAAARVPRENGVMTGSASVLKIPAIK
jgi:diguanylate cyclase (GGDEF)-like protein